ncbi:hypothetical protein cyc_03482 [Cyclospora cayetanensis]|uniref:Uncharacterized protein n=1 Tax=Cyclospora cayetanensis TaxID=88456 RepID=A0A1D3DB20_9EIME|nr:hypothetical protein cyc_03482 [Cyclospora cayetanensis]
MCVCHLLVQLTFNGEESIVTFRHPSCICFLTVHRILQGHQQQRLHQEKLRCGVAGLCFRNIRTASTRAGASFIVPYLDETGCTAAETTSASTSPVVERAATVSCLLKWSTFPPMSPAGLISGWSDEMGSKCWQEGQHVLQPTTGDKLACLAFKTRLACYTPQPVRCVALDKQCCFFAFKGSPKLYMHPLEWELLGGGALPTGQLRCVDTRAVNEPGLLGCPSLVSPARLVGRNGEREVQQMALQQLHIVGPFLVAARMHERLQLLLLPLQCQQQLDRDQQL